MRPAHDENTSKEVRHVMEGCRTTKQQINPQLDVLAIIVVVVVIVRLIVVVVGVIGGMGVRLVMTVSRSTP